MNQMAILNSKAIITEIGKLKVLNRMGTREERISKFDDTSLEITRSEKLR